LQQYLGKVASSACGIENLQLHLLVRAEDENGTAGNRHAAHAELGINHAKLIGKLPCRIGDDWIIEGAKSVVALHVLYPAKMILNAVTRQGDDLLTCTMLSGLEAENRKEKQLNG
jgi:hypothetical protein